MFKKRLVGAAHAPGLETQQQTGQRDSQGLTFQSRAAGNNRVIPAVGAVKGEVTACDWGESDSRLENLRQVL